MNELIDADERVSPARTIYSTTPPRRALGVQNSSAAGVRKDVSGRRRIGAAIALAAIIMAGAAMLVVSQTPSGGGSSEDLTVPIALTITVFLLAVWAWTSTRLDDTLVAFLAAIALIVTGVLPASEFFASLGDETIWLLIGAFMIATAVSVSGLPLRGAAQLLRLARGPRSLFHLTTFALILTAFAVPATSGRAALAVPVHAAISTAVPGRPALVRALALLMPTVVLLSAVGSLLGAGAHIITNQLLQAAGEPGFSFLGWLLLGLPLAVVSSHLACEIIVWRFLPRAERAAELRIRLDDVARASATPVSGPLSAVERRAALLLCVVIVLWSTEPLHRQSPALIALLGAVAAVTPGLGCTTLPAAVKKVPWSLLLFLAATLALASALTSTGAAAWLSAAAFAPLGDLGESGAVVFVVVVVAVSAAAHLLIPSRSARSAAIIPAVIAIAPALGVEPMAAAFASTAAAGFCHTLPSSAKPVAMFADPDVVTGGFTPQDLRRLSAVLAPVMVALVVVFAVWIWPPMGLPLLR